MTDKKYPVDFLNQTDVDGGDDGGDVSGGQGQEESWTQILDSLGVDARAMSKAEIQAIIRNYTEGKQASSNVYDIKSGEKVSSINRKESKEGDNTRYYTLSEDQSGPATSREVEESKSKDQRSDKEDKHTPSAPVFDPKPKGPGLS
jgi:hypothetical protein